LDISAGVKKSGGEEDDGFDYIYHLPSAPLDRILYRDPFKKSRMPEKTSSISALSQASRHSIKEIRGMLNPHQKTAKYRKRTVDRSNVGSNVGSQNSSQFMHPFDQQSNHSLISVQKDGLRRGMGIKQEISQKELDIGEDYLELIGVDVATFRAMPDWVYNYINPNSVAIFGFLVMVGMVLQVIVSNVTAQ
jgi:hypothetical protein